MTSEEQAFLAAIAATPADATPRLAFSDWLEEHDDPRFIWVRDEEIFPWMLPKLENPIPRMIAALATFFDENEIVDDVLAIELEAYQIIQLLERCGPATVEPMLQYFLSGEAWREAIVMVCRPHSEALAQHSSYLSRHAESPDADISQLALHLLVRAANVEPGILDSILMDVWRSGDERTDRALLVLQLATEPTATLIAETWAPHLLRELAATEPDDPAFVAAQLNCLAHMEQFSPQAVPVLQAAFRHKDESIAVAGASGLRRNEVDTDLLVELLNAPHPLGIPFFICNLTHQDNASAQVIDLAERTDIPPANLAAVLQGLTYTTAEKWPARSALFFKGIRHQNPIARIGAIKAIGDSNAPAPMAASLLREAMKDADHTVRFAAIETILAKYDFTEEQKIAASIAGLGDAHHEVRSNTMDNVRHNDELFPKVMRAAFQQLKQESPAARAQAAAAIVTMAPADSKCLTKALELLSDPETVVRRAVAHTLGSVVSMGATGVQKPLRRALKDPDAEVRNAAARAFSDLSNEASEHVPYLLELAKDESPRARSGAIYALAKISIYDEEVLKVVLRALRDESDRVVLAALEGLESTFESSEKVVKRILEYVDHENPAFRTAAFKALAYISEDEENPAVLAAALKGIHDAETSVAVAAMNIFQRCKKFAAPFLDEILEVYGLPTCTFHSDISWWLNEVPNAVPAFVRLLSSTNPLIRRCAIDALNSISVKKPEEAAGIAIAVLPHLKQMLATERGENTIALMRFAHVAGPKAAECYPQIQALMHHSNQQVRTMALNTVGRLGAVALPVVPHLQQLFPGIEDDDERAAALCSLMSLAHFQPALFPVVIARLQTEESNILSQMLQRIELHPELSSHTPLMAQLVQILHNHSDDFMRSRAAMAIGKMGAAAKPFLKPLLQELGSNSNFSTREYITNALGELGVHAVSTGPGLFQHYQREKVAQTRRTLLGNLAKIPWEGRAKAIAAGLKDGDGYVREAASNALGEIGDEALDVMHSILRALQNPKWGDVQKSLDESFKGIYNPGEMGDYLTNAGIDRRQFLLLVLDNLGPKAEEAIPVLAELLNDKHEGFRNSVLETLAKIGPAARPVITKALKSRDAGIRVSARAILDEWDEAD